MCRTRRYWLLYSRHGRTIKSFWPCQLASRLDYIRCGRDSFVLRVKAVYCCKRAMWSVEKSVGALFIHRIHTIYLRHSESLMKFLRSPKGEQPQIRTFKRDEMAHQLIHACTNHPASALILLIRCLLTTRCFFLRTSLPVCSEVIITHPIINAV